MPKSKYNLSIGTMLEASQLAIRCQSRRISIFHKFSWTHFFDICCPKQWFSYTCRNWIAVLTSDHKANREEMSYSMSDHNFTSSYGWEPPAPFPLCAHHLFPRGCSCWWYFSPNMPDCCLSTHLPLETPQTTALPAPSLQIPWAFFSTPAFPGIGNFLFPLLFPALPLGTACKGLGASDGCWRWVPAALYWEKAGHTEQNMESSHCILGEDACSTAFQGLSDNSDIPPHGGRRLRSALYHRHWDRRWWSRWV